MEPINLYIPRATGGRIVMGNPMVGFDKDRDGTPFKNKTTGEPITKYMFNVAVPKNDPHVNEILQQLHLYAHQTTPQFVGADGRELRDFAFKYDIIENYQPRLRYSCMELAAARPAPMARITVAAPRTMSPPA